MKIGIVQTSNLEDKINEALRNAYDRGESHVIFMIQAHALPKVVEFLREREEVSVLEIQEDSVFMIKQMRISFEIVEYYV